MAAVSGFPSLDTGIFGFPRGFHTGLSHVPQWCESTLGQIVAAVQVNQVLLEWTETLGVFWNDDTNPGVLLDFPC